MVSCGMKICKMLLFLFNFIFFLIGLALIIVGAVALAKAKDIIPDLEKELGSDVSAGALSGAAIFIIVLGAVVFIIGFFGCCGAWKESHCMLITFSVLLSVIFLLQLIAGIVAFVARGKVDKLMTDLLGNGVQKYDIEKTSDDPLVAYIDKMQTTYKCCGSADWKDWTKVDTKWKTENNAGVPDSCCKVVTKKCGATAAVGATDAIYTKGCYKELSAVVHDGVIAIGGVGIGLAFVELVGVIMACCLARAIKEDYNVA